MASTPAPMPEKASPIMLLRRSANQRAISAPVGTQLTAQAPAAASTPTIRYSAHNDPMRLDSTQAPPSTHAPYSMTRRGPRRSTSIPTGGDNTPCTTDEIENAAAVAPRDQPNSSMRATKKTGN